MSQGGSSGGRGRRARVIIEDDAVSTVGSFVAESSVGDPAPAEDRDEIAELFGDEREQYEDDDEEGENLFGDNMERDYQAQPELDQMSESGLDDASEYSEMSVAARRAAERAMADRDNMAIDDEHLFYEDGDAEDDVTGGLRRRRRRGAPTEDMSVVAEEIDDDIPIDVLENTRDRTAKEHVSDDAVGREIERRFRNFLRMFKDPTTKQNKYILAIKQMAADNRESLEVDYEDLSHESGDQNIVCYNCRHCYVSMVQRVTAEIKVRIKNFVIEEDIRMLRQLHLNMLIKTTGVVTVTTGILPQLAIIKYDCKACSFVLGPFVQRQDEEMKPSTCPSCQSRGPFELNVEQTVYHNYQRRLPRSKDVILLGDLCDTCKPGDEIELTGIYTNSYDGSLNSKQGFPVFSTVILANHIGKKDRIESESLTDEDIKIIQALSKDSQIARRIFSSIAPTIYGHDDIKQAIALALFRGESKNPRESITFEGILTHVAPRAILTTGQGASAVGLTAYVQRHP
uniref:DNA replication licensing factor MCM2 n=1 Tax=Ditylenchus dipsaci TaxID=166011 RepID=A0A915CM92_9BILA